MCNNINSVSSFVECVLTKLSSLDNKKDDFFFRGHAKNIYPLKPGVFRNLELLKNEDVMFREMMASNPSDFSDDRSTFDKLVRMQHYGLPTRLLDITTNPLIALYFACEEIKSCNNKPCLTNQPNNDTDGEVFIIGVKREDINFFDNDTTSVIANLARMEYANKDEIANKSSTCLVFKFIFNTKLQVKRLHHFIREEKSYFKPEIRPADIGRVICVRSKMSNVRVSSQAGAFLLFGHSEKPIDLKKNGFTIERIQIPGGCKKSIREQLDILNINASTVYPQLTSTAEYIKKKYS